MDCRESKIKTKRGDVGGHDISAKTASHPQALVMEVLCIVQLVSHG